MSDDRAIDKVRKLLNLAKDQGATEQERETAMRMAHAIMAKFNLDQADFEGVGFTEPRGVEESEFYGRPWARVVCIAMAQLFMCKYVYQDLNGTKTMRHKFVGKISNAQTACEMSRWLVESVLKEARKGARRAGYGNTWIRSFAVGASDRISHRVDQLIAQSQYDKSPGKGIVLASIYKIEEQENKKLFDQLFPNTHKARSGASTGLTSAFEAGERYGDSIHLNTQVQGTKPKLIK